ncbi:MAG: helix-turn-helix transcriptional regulator [Pseudomonadota bacterium]
MKDGPDIARIASLIGDPARANMLSALMGGKALTATELASEAGVTAATASGHLSKLGDGGLVRVNQQGRHRYFSLTGPEVAQTLESLMGLAQHAGAVRVRTGPRDPALRHARICYDHLAGDLGVTLYEGLLSSGAIAETGEEVSLTPPGREKLSDFGVDFGALDTGRRKLCRSCLDWSVRRSHLAGAVGAAIWQQVQAKDWAQRVENSRIVAFSSQGESEFRRLFQS